MNEIRLLIRTDKPEAELYIQKGGAIIDHIVWLAHRELSDTLLVNIRKLIEKNGMAFDDIGSIVAYNGPGSFTGLRIGISVANALGESIGVPVYGVTGENWLDKRYQSTQNTTRLATPFYGQEAHITAPKK